MHTHINIITAGVGNRLQSLCVGVWNGSDGQSGQQTIGQWHHDLEVLHLLHPPQHQQPFGERLAPQKSCKFTLHLMSVWHHNNHTISHCVWRVCDTTTIMQIYTVFTEHLASQQSCKFTLSLRSFNFAFTEHLAQQQSYKFTLQNCHLAFAIHIVEPSPGICCSFCEAFTSHLL